MVDITQYVMLELGQPMHAYDLAKLEGGLEARLAHRDEKATLLDGKEITLGADVLVIADAERARSAWPVSWAASPAPAQPDTTDILFEAAFFPPAAVAGRGRRYGLVTDAGQRFERGVDPAHQERAVERATQLLVEIAGGTAGPLHVTQQSDALPKRLEVALRRERIVRLLGIRYDDNDVKATLESLGMRVLANADGWLVTPPPHRFDINIEADLIEELARVLGFESIPEADAISRQRVPSMAETTPVESQALEILATRGYQEAITYAFVDPALQEKLFPGVVTPKLTNAISSEMSVMRASLWPGLIRAAQENQRRQQDRVRLFEHGARFETGGETDMIGRHRLGAASAGAVGRQGHAGRLLRCKAGSRGAVLAHRRVRRVRVRDRYIAVPASGAQRADHARRQDHRLDRRVAPSMGAGVRFHIWPDPVRSRVFGGARGKNAAFRRDFALPAGETRPGRRGRRKSVFATTT